MPVYNNYFPILDDDLFCVGIITFDGEDNVEEEAQCGYITILIL